MDGGEIIGLVAVIGLILVPSLGLTARFALKPIVESVLRLRDALDRQRPVPDDPRIAALQEDVRDLRETVERLATTAEFDAQLRAGVAGGPALPARSGAAVTATAAAPPVPPGATAAAVGAGAVAAPIAAGGKE